MKKLVICVLVVLSILLAYTAGRKDGTMYAIEKGFHFTVDCSAPDVTYDLYIELPDGNTYATTLFVC